MNHLQRMVCESELLTFVLDQIESLDSATLNDSLAKESSDAQKSFLDILNTTLHNKRRSRGIVVDDAVVLPANRV